jgi:hypothetical protein
MKKILSLTLIIFFSLNFKLSAQDFYNYYDIYKIEDDAQIFNNKSYSNSTKENSKILIKPQQNFDQFDNAKSRYALEAKESDSIKKPLNDKTKITTEYEEKVVVRKKSKSRTVGNYLGIDFINTLLRYRDIGYKASEPKELTDYTLPKYKNSFGIKYFYAINYNRFFLAPEIFFEYNNIKKHFDGANEVNGIDNQRLSENFGYKFMKIHRIYGGKINFGYDVTPNFSPFIFTGLSKIYYSNLDSIYTFRAGDSRYDVINATGKDPFSIIHKSKNVPFFGFGSKIKLSDHFSINAEYLIYNFLTKSNGYKNTDYNGSQNNVRADYATFDANLRIIKFGLLYNF